MAVFEIDALFRIFGPGYRDVDDSEKYFRFFECHDYATSAVKLPRNQSVWRAQSRARSMFRPPPGKRITSVHVGGQAIMIGEDTLTT